MYHDITVLVENLDVCRYFYREVLQLGEPFMDSNHTVVFRLGEEAFLVLEKCAGKFLEHTSSATRFTLSCPDLNALAEKMKKDAVELSDEFIRLGKTARRGFDPEGNIFIAVQQ